MRVLWIVLCLVASAATAAAQKVELGGRIAAGCLGSDGSGCGGGTSPLVGGHVSVWAEERIELSAGVARVERPSYTYPVDDEGATTITVSDRSRDFVSLLFVYHFLKGRPVRPMLGVGSGWYSDARQVTCQPSACEPLPPGEPALGRSRRWDLDLIFVVGFSGVIRDHWVVRGGWQSHRFANDENSTQQLFLALGYRLGR